MEASQPSHRSVGRPVRAIAFDSTQPETGTPSTTTSSPIEATHGIADDLQDDHDQDRDQEQQGRDGVARRRQGALRRTMRRRRTKTAATVSATKGQGRDHEVGEDLVEGAGERQRDGERGLDRRSPARASLGAGRRPRSSGRTTRPAPSRSRRGAMP